MTALESLSGSSRVRVDAIRPPAGRLGVLFAGMGAVATTMMAGVFLARRGRGRPVGALTQYGVLEGSAPGQPAVPIASAVPLAGLTQLAFGGWDIFPDDAADVAAHAEVLESRHLDEVRGELRAIRPMPAAFYPEYVRRLHGPNVKRAESKADMVEQLRADIRAFRRERECDRLVVVWCGSTEALVRPSSVHATAAAFEEGLRRDDPAISNAQLYAWACLQEGVPFANASPNLCMDFPAAIALARARAVPVAGKDLKTGQTLVKAVLAATLKARALGLRGWYSTNLLGNRDGEVLEDPDSFRAKEETKLGVLERLLEPQENRALYGGFTHTVRIDFYAPRGDAKEAWDNIDLFGWLDYPMQIKVNFLCRDSILAAPLVLDLVLFLDLAQRAGLAGVQDWLGFYFKSPVAATKAPVEHDVPAQLRRLKDVLRGLAGLEPALARPAP